MASQGLFAICLNEKDKKKKELQNSKTRSTDKFAYLISFPFNLERKLAI
jgi:hypothetical protein